MKQMKQMNKNEINRMKLSGAVIAAMLCMNCLLLGGCAGPAGSSPDNQTAETPKDIGDDAVVEIVLEHASGAGVEDITSFEKELEHGRYEYDVELVYNGREYEFEIDGSNGNILSLEID